MRLCAHCTSFRGLSTLTSIRYIFCIALYVVKLTCDTNPLMMEISHGLTAQWIPDAKLYLFILSKDISFVGLFWYTNTILLYCTGRVWVWRKILCTGQGTLSLKKKFSVLGTLSLKIKFYVLGTLSLTEKFPVLGTLGLAKHNPELGTVFEERNPCTVYWDFDFDQKLSD